MSLRTRFLAALLPALAAAPFALPGSALAVSCSNPGNSWIEYYSSSSGNILKQADIEENYSGHSATITFTASATTSVTDSVTSSYSLDAELKNRIFGGFEAKIGQELGYVGQVTTFASVSATYTLASGDSYVFYRGVRRYLSGWTHYYCDGQYQRQFWRSGNLAGYAARVSGVVACKASPPSGSLAYVAKSRYCV